jgi:predicted transposase YdaD
MPGPWDSAGKRLLREVPQHVVSWLLKGATFLRTLPTELKSRNIFADGLYEIQVHGQPALMHIEFQSRQHTIMPLRLLEYNVLSSSENDWWPVYTFVIYLRKDGDVPQSPLIRKLRNGEEYQRFYFTVIEMANISARQLLQMGLHGLYPLILLAKGGTEPEVVREMVTDLTEARELELLALAYTFGGLAPGSEAYESWFRRSFAMLDDILEDSWTYQEIVKKGMQKGLQQGMQQGREEERQKVIRGQRETLLEFVHRRFPELNAFAEVHVENIKDTDAMQRLLNQLLFTVQTVEEAKQAIVDVSMEEAGG